MINDKSIYIEDNEYDIPDARPDIDRKPNIVWIAAYPKSGSTWMRLFLHAYLGDGTVDLNGYKGFGDMNRHFYKSVAPGPIEKLSDMDTFFLRTAALYHISCMPHDQIVKTHCCFGRCLGVDLIPRELTKGAIVIVRDPRDIAISYAHHSGSSIDAIINTMGQIGAFIGRDGIYQYTSSWSVNVKSWFAGPRGPRSFPVLVVKFEDMLARPFETFRHIAVAIQPEVSEGKLEQSIFSTRFENLALQEEEEGFREKPDELERFFREGKAGGWKDILTPEQARRIETDHGEVMKQFGYLS